MMSALKIVIELSKIRIAVMATATALMGYVLAARGLSPDAVLPLAGVFLLACGAGALNQAQEPDIDACMNRTRNRPIPSGRLDVPRAVAIALLLLALGLACLSGNREAVALGVLTVAWYNGVYTYLKRTSPFAAIPGGVVGALPPVIGWVAAGGELFDPRIGVIAIFFFVWQVPHFWLLLMRIGPEYAKAGLPTLTSLLTRRQLASVTWVWMVATGVACMVIPLLLAPGLWVYAALFAASAWMVWGATRMLRSGGTFLAFKEINLYALAVMSLLSLSGFLR